MLNLSTSHEKLIAVAWRTPLFMSFLLCSNIQSTRSCMKWRSTSKQEHPPLGNANRCLYRIMQCFFMSGIRFFVSQGRYTKTMQTTIRKQSWKIIMLSFPNTTFDNGISYWKIQQSGWKACNMLQLTRSLFSAKRTYAPRSMNVNHSSSSSDSSASVSILSSEIMKETLENSYYARFNGFVASIKHQSSILPRGLMGMMLFATSTANQVHLGQIRHFSSPWF